MRQPKPHQLLFWGTVILVASAAVIQAAQSSPPLTPQQLLSVPTISDVQISPDGKDVAFVVSKVPDLARKPKQRTSEIWVIPVEGHGRARPIAPALAAEGAPRWSPDGNYLAFLANPADSHARSNPGAQIYLVRSTGGEVRQLTHASGGVELFKWCPGGKVIAFTVRAPSPAAPPALFKGDDVIEVGLRYRFSHLWTVRVSDLQTREVTREQYQVSDFEWSPDGTALALRLSDTPRLDDEFWHSRLVVILLSTGRIVRTISSNVSPWEGTVRWSPDSRYIVFPEFTPTKIASWLVLDPVNGGRKRYLLKDYPATVRTEEWTSDSKHLWVTAISGTKEQLLYVDVVGDSVDRVIAPGRAADFSITRDGKAVAYLCQPRNSPPDVCATIAGGMPLQLTHLYSDLSVQNLGTARQIAWRSTTDGRVIDGVLVTPPGFKSDHPYPTVVLAHGGPMMAWSDGWHDWSELLSSNGYVVLLPNPRGSEGQGWKFAELDLNDWGGGDFRDIMDGVNYLVRRQIADPSRLGIGGWSFGGFMTAWAVTQTNRFKAAVEGAGLTDLLSFDGEPEISPSFLEIYFLGTPFQRWADYREHSPIYFLPRCKTPTLIMHGLADTVVPVGQSWEFYSGLRMLGVPTRLVLYPREWHVFSEPVHQADVLTRMLAWYNQYLK
jgi:dipeptidyl aminopeptidase/acylaminoacyl peptidase